MSSHKAQGERSKDITWVRIDSLREAHGSLGWVFDQRGVSIVSGSQHLRMRLEANELIHDVIETVFTS